MVKFKCMLCGYFSSKACNLLTLLMASLLGVMPQETFALPHTECLLLFLLLVNIRWEKKLSLVVATFLHIMKGSLLQGGLKAFAIS